MVCKQLTVLSVCELQGQSAVFLTKGVCQITNAWPTTLSPCLALTGNHPRKEQFLKTHAPASLPLNFPHPSLLDVPLQVCMQCPLFHMFLCMPQLRNEHWYEAPYSNIPSYPASKTDS